MSAINTYAIVENGAVINVVLWDGQSGWQPPAGSTANLLPIGAQVGVGYTFDGTNYTEPTNPAA